LLRRLYDPETQFQLIICSDADLHRRKDVFLSPPPIEVPPLTDRVHELPRIVEEYALDALHVLDAPRKSFTSADRDWVLAHEAQSLSAIERATLRLIALRTSPNVNRAAARLGMAHVSLTRWIRRRKKLPVQTR
jgi:DNA-binding NtrC family response regulator